MAVARAQRYIPISSIASELARKLRYVYRPDLADYFRQAGSSRELDSAKSAGIVKRKHPFVTPAEIAQHHFRLRIKQEHLDEAGIDLNSTASSTTPPSIASINLRTTVRNGPPSPPPRSEVLPNYPKRGPLTRAYPHLANVGFWLYLGLRLCSIAMVSLISFPIAIALFAAEFHSIFNGIFFQGDIKNEGRYETWKRQNWPSDTEIRQAMRPDSPKTVMHISSAFEPPDTVWPTLYGVLEMEGNKQVVWNSESTKLDNTKDTALIYSIKKELLDTVNKEYRTVWQYIQSCVARNDTVIKRAAIQDNRRMNRKRFMTPSHVERVWERLNIAGKRAALQEIWRMLGKRFITRGGIWVWWGSESLDMPNDAEFTSFLHRVYHGPLRNLGDVPEVGLWKEVDIESLGFMDDNSQFHSFANNLGVLTAKVKSYLQESRRHIKSPSRYMRTSQKEITEQQLYGFAYMRRLLAEYKQDQLDAGGFEYFPRNIRSAGEDIKTGLEYEARAEEVGRLNEAILDEEWERIFNTYRNAQVIWWDRMQLIDSDPQGRKANSLNSCVHHLQGDWQKVIEKGANPIHAKTDGYLIAKDLPSAIMRLCIENFENGQQVWKALRPKLEELERQGIQDIDRVTDAIVQELGLQG